MAERGLEASLPAAARARSRSGSVRPAPASAPTWSSVRRRMPSRERMFFPVIVHIAGLRADCETRLLSYLIGEHQRIQSGGQPADVEWCARLRRLCGQRKRYWLLNQSWLSPVRPSLIHHFVEHFSLMAKADKKVNVAIIGLGFGAEFIPIYQNHPSANMYAICQRNKERLSKVGDEFGIGKRYSEYDDVLADPT